MKKIFYLLLLLGIKVISKYLLRIDLLILVLSLFIKIDSISILRIIIILINLLDLFIFFWFKENLLLALFGYKLIRYLNKLGLRRKCMIRSFLYLLLGKLLRTLDNFLLDPLRSTLLLSLINLLLRNNLLWLLSKLRLGLLGLNNLLLRN